jgi:hypothetical protein
MKQDTNRIRKWLENGKNKRSTHVIVVYNVNERDMRPLYVSTGQNIVSRIQSVNNDYTLRPVEVYNLSMDIDRQLLQARTWNT